MSMQTVTTTNPVGGTLYTEGADAIFKRHNSACRFIEDHLSACQYLMQECSLSLARSPHCVKTLTVMYASTHIIDEIGLWQLKTKSRVLEQEQGGCGEGG